MSQPDSAPADARHSRYAHHLPAFDRVWAPVHQEIIDWLAIPPGAWVLDAGCGAGGVTALLAAAVGDAGSVAALEIRADGLATTRAVVETTPYSGRVAYCQGDVLALPFPDNSFDLAWCSRVIHGLGDQLAGVRELRRVVKPGGRGVLREGGTGLRMLPPDIGIGVPGLEDRLRVAYLRWFYTDFRPALPGAVPYPFGWTQMLRDAGFSRVTARSFWLELLPPFTDEQRAWLHEQLRGPLNDGRLGKWVEPDDRRTLELLTDPDGPHYFLNRPDLHVLAATTAYVGWA